MITETKPKDTAKITTEEINEMLKPMALDAESMDIIIAFAKLYQRTPNKEYLKKAVSELLA